MLSDIQNIPMSSVTHCAKKEVPIKDLEVSCEFAHIY